MSAVTPTAIGIGANQGDPPACIRRAAARLAAGGLRSPRLSSLYRTAPLDCDPGTPPFVNAALTGEWPGSARDLHALCQAVERALGRSFPHSSRQARPIDLDLLLFGSTCLAEPGLTLPHPRLAERLFVLVPLAEIAPDWTVPPSARTVADLCRDLRRQAPAGQGIERLDEPRGPGATAAE